MTKTEQLLLDVLAHLEDYCGNIGVTGAIDKLRAHLTAPSTPADVCEHRFCNPGRCYQVPAVTPPTPVRTDGSCMVKAPCRLCEMPTPYRFAIGHPASPAYVPCCGKFECEAAVKVEANGGTITKPPVRTDPGEAALVTCGDESHGSDAHLQSASCEHPWELTPAPPVPDQSPPGYRIVGRSGPGVMLPVPGEWIRFARRRDGADTRDKPRLADSSVNGHLWRTGQYDILEPIPQQASAGDLGTIRVGPGTAAPPVSPGFPTIHGSTDVAIAPPTTQPAAPTSGAGPECPHGLAEATCSTCDDDAWMQPLVPARTEPTSGAGDDDDEPTAFAYSPGMEDDAEPQLDPSDHAVCDEAIAKLKARVRETRLRLSHALSEQRDGADVRVRPMNAVEQAMANRAALAEKYSAIHKALARRYRAKWNDLCQAHALEANRVNALEREIANLRRAAQTDAAAGRDADECTDCPHPRRMHRTGGGCEHNDCGYSSHSFTPRTASPHVRRHPGKSVLPFIQAAVEAERARAAGIVEEWFDDNFSEHEYQLYEVAPLLTSLGSQPAPVQPTTVGERVLAKGWSRAAEFHGEPLGCTSYCDQPVAYYEVDGNDSTCEAHAEKVGVFATPEAAQGEPKREE